MLHAIEVRRQIQIDDVRLLFNDCSCYSGHGFVCCPFWSITIRPCLEIRFKDWLQDKL